MSAVITYETVREDTGNIRVFAVLNKNVLEDLGEDKMKELFYGRDGCYPVVSRNADFALIVDADLNEEQITIAIDILNDSGKGVDIRTQQIENRMGLGTDINPTAKSVLEVVARVEGWLESGKFAPVPDDAPAYPE